MQPGNLVVRSVARWPECVTEAATGVEHPVAFANRQDRKYGFAVMDKTIGKNVLEGDELWSKHFVSECNELRIFPWRAFTAFGLVHGKLFLFCEFPNRDFSIYSPIPNSILERFPREPWGSNEEIGNNAPTALLYP